MTRHTLLALGLLTLADFASAAATSDELMRQIDRADRALFDAVFERCDADAVGTMITDDFEFYHDKGGQVARSKAEFVAKIRQTCANQETGKDPKARRVILPGSVEVFPMKGLGAVQMGSHRFYQRREGGPDVPTEQARFTHLWRIEGDRWLLARVISYHHVARTQ